MNLLMIAPLCDSRGTIRYFIGAQVDVSGLVKECSDMESLHRLVIKSDHEAEMRETGEEGAVDPLPSDEFQELSEMLNLQELDTVRRQWKDAQVCTRWVHDSKIFHVFCTGLTQKTPILGYLSTSSHSDSKKIVASQETLV